MQTMLQIVQVDPNKIKSSKASQTKYQNCIYYTFILTVIISTIVVSLTRYYATIDKLMNTTTFNRTLNVIYLSFLQLILIYAFIAIGFMADALFRIRKNLNAASREWESNTKFTIYHILSFSLYCLNVLVYDVLMLVFANEALP